MLNFDFGLIFLLLLNGLEKFESLRWEHGNASSNKYLDDCESNLLTNEGDVNYLLNANFGNLTVSLTLNSLLPMTIVDS